MGIFSKIFGNNEVVKKGMNLIDEAFYTDDEKDTNKIEKIKQKIEIIKSYEPFKLAQRYIAVIVLINFTIAFQTCLILTVVNITTSQNYDLKSIFELLNVFNISTIMIVICSFYFGGGAIESWRKKFNTFEIKKNEK